MITITSPIMATKTMISIAIKMQLHTHTHTHTNTYADMHKHIKNILIDAINILTGEYFKLYGEAIDKHRMLLLRQKWKKRT